MQRLIRFFILRLFLFLVLSVLTIGNVSGQFASRLYKSDYRIDAEQKGDLRLTLDNLSFFKNNEFAGDFIKGYSLPGFWIQPKVTYQPLENVRLEAGIHALCYWGAEVYPNYAYQDIPNWKSDRYQVGMHVLPYFRAQMSFGDRLQVVLGNLYGGANHDLIEPLYHPELNFTADPESGLQVLYDRERFHFDAWLNWQSFIFNDDFHQEVFTVGISTKVLLNSKESRFHFYVPIQGLTQHRGGEIDTITHQSVQTLMNGAIGAGIRWNAGKKILKYMELEADVAGYYQQAGELWPYDSGSGFYLRSAAKLGNIKLKASYWKCRDFISMFGNAFYGAVSISHEDMLFESPGLIYLGAEYSYQLGKGYSIGVDFDLYYHTSMSGTSPDGSFRNPGTSSYTYGVYLRMTPSFLLKKF